MGAVIVPEGLYYWTGEKPPPLPWRYEDEANDLISSISGATITAKCKTDDGSEADVACTNTGDGSGTIDWDTSTSDFALAAGVTEGRMRIDLEVDEGGGVVWHLPRFSIPVLSRT